MQNKIVILLIVLISGFSQLALAEEINVTDADYVWNLTLDTNTNIIYLVGEPGVMVVKYADDISYTPMEDATSVNHLVGEPGVMVVKYADVISYIPMENLPSECPADITGDGTVDIDDLFEILNNWGGISPDLTGDGNVDIDDLFVILNAWGPCP